MGFLCAAITVYTFILFARIILSWVTMFRGPSISENPAVKVIYDLTEPVMKPLRDVIPAVGGLDLSPLIIFLILGAAQGVLCGA